MMRVSYTLLLTFVVTGLAVLLSGCAGGGSYSVYSGYGYPYSGHSVGYRTVYYDDDVGHRREHRRERVQDMSPSQRQSRQVNRSTRNMGRPRMGGGRR